MATRDEAIVSLGVLSHILDEYAASMEDETREDAKFAFRVLCEFVAASKSGDIDDPWDRPNPHPEWPIEPLCYSFHYPISES